MMHSREATISTPANCSIISANRGSAADSLGAEIGMKGIKLGIFDSVLEQLMHALISPYMYTSEARLDVAKVQFLYPKL